MTAALDVEAVVSAVAAGRLPDRDLPTAPTLDQVMASLDLEPIGTELLGRRGRTCQRFSVESFRYEAGLVVHADGEGRIVLVMGVDPVEPSGARTLVDEDALARLGTPTLVLDAALGGITVASAEWVWPEQGVAVRTNPGNGLLLALLAFVPTDADTYLAEVRPDAEPRTRMAGIPA